MIVCAGRLPDDGRARLDKSADRFGPLAFRRRRLAFRAWGVVLELDVGHDGEDLVAHLNASHDPCGLADDIVVPVLVLMKP